MSDDLAGALIPFVAMGFGGYLTVATYQEWDSFKETPRIRRAIEWFGWPVTRWSYGLMGVALVVGGAAFGIGLLTKG